MGTLLACFNCSRARVSSSTLVESQGNVLLSVVSLVAEDRIFPGQSDAVLWVEIENNDTRELYVVEAAMRSEPEAIFNLDFSRDQRISVQPGETTTFAMSGSVDALAQIQTVLAWPIVRAARPLGTESGVADVAAGPWSIEIGAAMESLLVDSIDDDLDGGTEMLDRNAAGLSLSLREAITLVNNGHALTRIEFDAALFAEGLAATIHIGTGNAGPIPLPAMTTARTTIDGRNRSVRLSVASTAEASHLADIDGAILRVRASSISLAGLTTAAAVPHLSAAYADSLRIDDVVFDGAALPAGTPLATVSHSPRAQISGATFIGGGPDGIVVQHSDTSRMVNIEMRQVGLRVSDCADWQVLGLQAADIPGAEPLIVLARTPDAVVRDVGMASLMGAAIVIEQSPRVAIESLLASSADSSVCFPLVDVVQSSSVSVRKIEYSGTCGPSLVLDEFSNTDAVGAPIEYSIDTLMGGNTTAPDETLVDIYRLGTDWRIYETTATVRGSAWSHVFSGPLDPADVYATVSTLPTGSSSLLSPAHRTAHPGYCGTLDSVFASSFESGEMGSWDLGGSLRQESGTHAWDGTAMLAVAGGGEARLLETLDIAPAKRLEVRMMRRMGDGGGYLNVDHRPVGSATWTEGDAAPRSVRLATWTPLNFTISPAVASGPTEFRLRASTSGGVGVFRFDQFEICSVPD